MSSKTMSVLSQVIWDHFANGPMSEDPENAEVRAVRDEATAILKGLETAGYVIVPKTLTQEMAIAGLEAEVADVYDTMGPVPDQRDDMTQDELLDRYVRLGMMMRSSAEIEAAWAAMLALSQGDAAVLPRCAVTGNPCGTDTVMVGYECPCENCRQWHGTP